MVWRHKKSAPDQGRSAIAPRGTTHVCRMVAASHRDNGDESVRAYQPTPNARRSGSPRAAIRVKRGIAFSAKAPE